MTPRAPANPYLRTKILTASPEELRLMLYEGAIRFCGQGREAIVKKDWEASYSALVRAQKIVLELSTSLNHGVAPELCEKLGALYTYIYRRLIDANIQHDLAALDEAVRLLDYEKKTWEMLMARISGNEVAEPADTVPVAPVNEPAAPAPGAISGKLPSISSVKPGLANLAQRVAAKKPPTLPGTGFGSPQTGSSISLNG